MSTAAFGRSKSGDRFYNPPARRQLQLQLQQQQQQQLLLQQKNQQQLEEREEIRVSKLQNQRNRRRSSPAAENGRVKSPSASSSEIKVEFDDCASTATTTTAAAETETPVASVSPKSSSSTNIDRFLECTTPSVRAQYFSKSRTKGWRTQKDKLRPYFVLGDLWESFKEWSAYGAGVPLLINETDTVIQYYVPYLSGIQLYIDPSKPSPVTRRPGEESDESFRETSSDGSSDCETERGPNSFGGWRKQELAESTLQGLNGLSLQLKPLNCSSSDEGESSGSPGALVFEYFARDSPFIREPLADKISLLASNFPELKTYRSYELSPSSWVSIAWYPIYRIPTGPTLQNFDSSFLTYHSLSTTPVNGGREERQCHFGSVPSYLQNGLHMAVKLPLPTFGLACYRFKNPIWDQNGVDESSKINSLVQAADDWLRQLNVNHPDYSFFSSNGNR